MTIERKTLALRSTTVKEPLEIAQEPGANLGELDLIEQLRALKLIEQPAANVDVYLGDVEHIVNQARDFFQAHRGVSCALVVEPKG